MPSGAGISDDEGAVVRERHLPDLDRDRRTFRARHAHQPGLGRHGAGQGIEAVVRRGRRRRDERGAALRQLAVERHARQVGADDGDLHHRRRRHRGQRLGRRQRRAGRAQRQPGGVVEALAQLGQLEVAAAAADQRDAEGQAVVAQAARHRDRRVVEQVHEVGVLAQVAVERDRRGQHLLDRVVRRRGGHQQHVDVVPHRGRALAQRVQLRAGVDEVGRAVAPAGGQDAAHRLDHLVFVRIEEAAHRRIALGHQRAVVEQRGRLRQRRVVDRDRRAAQRLHLRDRVLEGRSRQRVAEEARRAAARRSGIARAAAAAASASGASTGRSASKPIAACSTRAARPTVPAKIDTQSTLCAAGTTPRALISPRDGLMPTMLLSPAGTRPEPAVSVPSAKSTWPVATT